MGISQNYSPFNRWQDIYAYDMDGGEVTKYIKLLGLLWTLSKEASLRRGIT